MGKNLIVLGIVLCVFSFSGCCLRFSDLALDTVYHVGDTFTTSGKQVKVERFQWGGGAWTDEGRARVDGRHYARGSGRDMNAGNVNLKFLFDYPISKLSLKFAEFGGNVNLRINGDHRNTSDFIDLHGSTVGGVLVDVQAVQEGGHNWYGSMTLTGTIDDVAIGGQELWLDDVCATK